MVEFEIESWSHGKLNIAKAVVDKIKEKRRKILKSSVDVYNDIV